MARSEILEVHLEGKLCGQVEKSDSGNLNFTYEPSYPATATPLSLSMPIEVGTFPKRSIFAYLENLLPDNPNALNALAQRFSVSPNSPFELIKHIGRDLSGAVQFIPEGESLSPDDDKVPAVLTEREIAQLLIDKKGEYSAGVPITGITGVFSAAGMQPKILLHKSEVGWCSPNNLYPSTHIIKPIPATYPDLDLNEFITQTAAKKLGLNVATTTIQEFDGISCLVSERYDRQINSEGLTIRIHQEDLCQALSINPGKKYQRIDGGPGVAAIASLFKKTQDFDDRRQLQEKFFKALVFNTISRCSDAHAKNYSILLKGSKVALAPLYDLNTGIVYSEYDQASMSIDGEYFFSKMTTKGLLGEAKRIGVETDYANSVVEEIKSGLSEAFLAALEDLKGMVAYTVRVKDFEKSLLHQLRVFETYS